MLPNFFTLPPSPILRDAAARAAVPAGFCGRAGILLTEKNGRIAAETAFEPLSRGRAASWRGLKEKDLWPGLSENEVPEVGLADGRGRCFTLKDFLAGLFAAYPDRPALQGGLGLEERKRGWRFAVTDALSSPAVRLVLGFCRRRDGSTPVGLAEWWVGPSPAHEVRFDGTFYPPRAAAKFLLEALLEGIPVEPARPVCAPDDVPPLPVIYEDDAVVAVNKPTRLASVPGIRECVSAKSLLERERGPLCVVHRLDTDTSGVLVFAKTPQAERTLHAAFREGLAMKRYEARLEGTLTAVRGRIELPLALNRLDRPRQCVLPESEGGRPAATDWELIGEASAPDGTKKAVVSLWPETGRTHQLRVHCAHAAGLGVPIDGDSFYGRLGILGEDRRTRLCLHAAELTIPHPATNLTMTLEAPAEFPHF